jgi:two-component system invasion response regulator UvrY
MIEVILCDDHALVRRGIRDTLSDATDIRVVGEAGDYGELRALMRSLSAAPGKAVPCDVLVLDINLPGRSGLDALHALKDEGSPIKVLVVSMYPEDQYAIRALRAGAFGYVNKGGDPQMLVQAVRTVAQGRKYVTPEIAQMLVESLTAPSTRKRAQQAQRPRTADPGDDRQRQAPGRHRRRADAQPQDRLGVPRPRAGKAAAGQQLRTHGLCHPQRVGGAVTARAPAGRPRWTTRCRSARPGANCCRWR